MNGDGRSKSPGRYRCGCPPGSLIFASLSDGLSVGERSGRCGVAGSRGCRSHVWGVGCGGGASWWWARVILSLSGSMYGRGQGRAPRHKQGVGSWGCVRAVGSLRLRAQCVTLVYMQMGGLRRKRKTHMNYLRPYSLYIHLFLIINGICSSSRSGPSPPSPFSPRRSHPPGWGRWRRAARHPSAYCSFPNPSSRTGSESELRRRDNDTPALGGPCHGVHRAVRVEGPRAQMAKAEARA